MTCSDISVKLNQRTANIHYVHGRTLGSFPAHLKTCSDQVLGYTCTIHTTSNEKPLINSGQ